MDVRLDCDDWRLDPLREEDPLRLEELPELGECEWTVITSGREYLVSSRLYGRSSLSQERTELEACPSKTGGKR